MNQALNKMCQEYEMLEESEKTYSRYTNTVRDLRIAAKIGSAEGTTYDYIELGKQPLSIQLDRRALEGFTEEEERKINQAADHLLGLILVSLDNCRERLKQQLIKELD